MRIPVQPKQPDSIELSLSSATSLQLTGEQHDAGENKNYAKSANNLYLCVKHYCYAVHLFLFSSTERFGRRKITPNSEKKSF